jgi:hypothetical protein
VNTLVVGPGQYSFGDLVKLGVPFTIIVAIVSVLLVPIFLPFQYVTLLRSADSSTALHVMVQGK